MIMFAQGNLILVHSHLTVVHILGVFNAQYIWIAVLLAFMCVGYISHQVVGPRIIDFHMIQTHDLLIIAYCRTMGRYES